MEVAEKTSPLVTRYVVVGDLLTKRSFDSFESLRKETNKQLAEQREYWLKMVLKKHEVKIRKKNKTARQIHEQYEANKLVVVREKTDNEDVDRVYKDGVLIGEWHNGRDLRIDKWNRLTIQTKYSIL